MVTLRSQTAKRRQPPAEIQPADSDDAPADGDTDADRSGTTTSAQEWLLDNELLVRQTIVTSGVWLVFIGFGAYLNIGVRPDKEHIPLVWFDYVMRRAGPALPLPALVLRWYASLPPADAPTVRQGPALLPLLAVYAAVTVSRLGTYFAHMALAPLVMAVQADQLHPHFLSDHIFLGASLVAIFNAEAHILVGHLRRPWLGMTPLDRRIIVAALLLTVVLYVLTAAENHYTARFFHGGSESFWAAVLGLILFQIPTAFCVARLSVKF